MVPLRRRRKEAREGYQEVLRRIRQKRGMTLLGIFPRRRRMKFLLEVFILTDVSGKGFEPVKMMKRYRYRFPWMLRIKIYSSAGNIRQAWAYLTLNYGNAAIERAVLQAHNGHTC